MKNNRRPLDYPVAELLSQQVRVLQIHPVGFGASDRPDDYDFGRIGDQVRAVLDHEGIDRFAVWGFSQPGCMSAIVARSTDRADALVMGGVTPIGFPTDGDPAIRKLRRLRPVLEGIGFTYLEFEGLNHGTCGLGDASADGRRVAQAVVDCLISRGAVAAE